MTKLLMFNGITVDSNVHIEYVLLFRFAFKLYGL